MNIVELHKRMKAAEAEARKLMAKTDRTAEDVSKADSLIDECERLQKDINVEKRLEALDQLEAEKQVNSFVDTVQTRSDSGISATVFGTKVTKDQTDKLHIGHVLRAMLHGAKSEAERQLLISGTGQYLVPEVIMNQVIDQLRSQSIPGQVGAQFIKLDSPADVYRIPKITTDATFEWKAENASQSPSTPVLSEVQLAPKTCRALMTYSRELAADSLLLPETLNTMFVGALSDKINDAFLFGGSDAPSGIEDLSNLTLTYDYSSSFASQTVTAASLYFPFLKCWGELLNAKVPMNTPLSIIINPEIYAEILGCLEATTGNPLAMPKILEECNWVVSAACTLSATPGARTTKIFMGAGSEGIVGIRQELSGTILKELYAANNAIGALVSARLDIAHRHNASWAVIANVSQNGAWS